MHSEGGSALVIDEHNPMAVLQSQVSVNTRKEQLISVKDQAVITTHADVNV